MTLGAGGHWRNWAGNQSFVARHMARPESEAEIAALAAEATQQGLGVRAAGSGHSFTPVVATSGLLLSLERHAGIIAIDAATRRVRVKAGTRIGDVGRALKQHGLSLINQGDIDTQALAGALSTGTHGTGATLGNMASQVVGMRLVQPDGSVLDLADGDTRLPAARVSLGLLGVVSEYTLQTMPAYNLKEVVWRDSFEACMEQHDGLAAQNRHFAFFWCPVPESRHLYCLADTSSVSNTPREHDVCEMKVMNITEDAPYTRADGFEKVAYSSEIYPIEYVPNFHELEYAVPVSHAKQALREVRDLMLTRHRNCIYPVEYRFTAGDSGWISPFFEQDSVTISVSGGPGIDYWDYLRDVDSILRQYGSRPHWGKLHFTNTDDMPRLFRRYGEFVALRRALDPAGVFLNDHLRNLFA